MDKLGKKASQYFRGKAMSLLGSDIDFMPEPEALLKVGDRVVNNNGHKGTVRLSGPYGDQPFQVKADSCGRFCCGVWSDGTVHQSDMVWEVIDV